MRQIRPETPSRIEPARLEQVPEAVADAVAELAACSAALGKGLHPRTAASLADAVRVMNCYYSNLIEGHNTRPPVAHIRVQREIDRQAAEGRLPEPASGDWSTA